MKTENGCLWMQTFSGDGKGEMGTVEGGDRELTNTLNF